MKRIKLFLACLLIFISIGIGQIIIYSDSNIFCAESKSSGSSPINTSDKTPLPIDQATPARSNETNKSVFIVQIIASLIGGGLAGAGVNILFARRQSKKELRSLILAFASEMTFAFVRCVKYYEQSKKPEISYSGLFDFTEASILSRFATVTSQPEVVAAIIDLKSNYFQIRRHVEEASKFAAQADRLTENEKDRGKLMRAARHAQGTALAFFFSSYENIVQNTKLIFEEAKKICRSKVVADLEQKFKDAEVKKIQLDKEATKINAETSPNAMPKK